MDIEKLLELVYSEKELAKVIEDNFSIFELLQLYDTIEIEPTYHKVLAREIIVRLVNYSDIPKVLE